MGDHGSEEFTAGEENALGHCLVVRRFLHHFCWIQTLLKRMLFYVIIGLLVRNHQVFSRLDIPTWRQHPKLFETLHRVIQIE